MIINAKTLKQMDSILHMRFNYTMGLVAMVAQSLGHLRSRLTPQMKGLLK